MKEKKTFSTYYPTFWTIEWKKKLFFPTFKAKLKFCCRHRCFIDFTNYFYFRLQVLWKASPSLSGTFFSSLFYEKLNEANWIRYQISYTKRIIGRQLTKTEWNWKNIHFFTILYSNIESVKKHHFFPSFTSHQIVQFFHDAVCWNQSATSTIHFNIPISLTNFCLTIINTPCDNSKIAMFNNRNFVFFLCLELKIQFETWLWTGSGK